MLLALPTISKEKTLLSVHQKPTLKYITKSHEMRPQQSNTFFEWSPPSGMSSWHCILHTVWQVFWQFSFWHAIWLILWHVFWLSIWHTFWHIWWLTLYLTRIMVVTIYLTYFLTFYLTYIWTCCLIYYLICHDMIDIFGQTSWHRFWHSMRINSCNIYIYTIFYMSLRKPTFYKK